MELKRILAKDSRTAMDIAMNRYGKEVLVVSSQSVGGQVELVVALDVQPEPVAAPAPAAVAPAPSAFTQAFLQALGPMPPAPEAPAVAATDAGPAAGTGNRVRADAPVMSAAQAFKAAREGAAAAPARKPVSASAPATPARRAVAAGATPAAAAGAGVPDADPGLQAIDLVRREIAALRKEFALSRQVQTWQDGRQWPAALAPVIHALQEQAVPAGLRALLIDGAQEATDPDEALQAMRQLVSDALSAPAAVRLERGVHAIVGPSGAGKTHMVTRLARAAALRAGAQQVAVIAFNDQRFGAWSHTRVMAAQAGVQCLRAGDVPTLRLLLDELSGHALVFIDTAGADALAQARLLQEMNLGIHLHLLMPADASIGSVRTLVDSGLTWRSLMVGKVDESISPWPLLQALCEGKPPVSYMSDSGQVQAPPRAFEARQLVDAAFERLAAELQALGLSPEVEVEVGSPALAGRLAGARIQPAAGAKVALS